jgi:hypothetical protein
MSTLSRTTKIKLIFKAGPGPELPPAFLVIEVSGKGSKVTIRLYSPHQTNKQKTNKQTNKQWLENAQHGILPSRNWGQARNRKYI